MKWNAQGYDIVSSVQEGWGRNVLDEIPLAGNETVLDAGCGSGRVTQILLDRLPSGFVFAVDKSPEMIEQAKERLASYSNKIQFTCSDLCEVKLPKQVDVIFSNAVFHWVPDHLLLFKNLASAIRQGGLFRTQCGGKGNLDRIRVISEQIALLPEFEYFFRNWKYPTNYANAEETAERMKQSGFINVETNLTEAPADFNSREEFTEFVKNVVILAYLNRLPDQNLKESFIYKFVDGIEQAFSGRYWLDYVRLNIAAIKN